MLPGGQNNSREAKSIYVLPIFTSNFHRGQINSREAKSIQKNLQSWGENMYMNLQNWGCLEGAINRTHWEHGTQSNWEGRRWTIWYDFKAKSHNNNWPQPLKTEVYEIRAHSDVFQQFVVERRKKVESLLPVGDGRRADWEGKVGVQIGKRPMCNRRWQGRRSLACRRVE
jgi:hypothetical protein